MEQGDWSRSVLEKVTTAEHAKLVPGGFGEELGVILGYMHDFGCHGGDHLVTFSSDMSTPAS